MDGHLTQNFQVIYVRSLILVLGHGVPVELQVPVEASDGEVSVVDVLEALGVDHVDDGADDVGGVPGSAVKRSIGFTITEKAPTRAFSWLKALLALSHLRHYAKWALTPRSLNVKMGPRRNYHKGRAGWLA